MGKQTKEGAIPYDKLFIYYFDGKVPPSIHCFGPDFIGNWEEGDTSFLFFSESADDAIEQLIAGQPQLKLKDRFCMSYDEWHGDPVQPFRVGRFFVMPPWKKVETEKDEVPVLLDPGVVFGAGTHPTTVDCLEAIEIVNNKCYIESSIDLGTGTGLLAIAAAKFGCPRNFAVDNNFLAVKTARKNILLNKLSDKVCPICGSAEDLIDLPADLMIANIHYDVMKRLVAHSAFQQKKWFILSGLLRSEAKEIEVRLSRYSFNIIKKWVKDGVWHTFLVKSSIEC
jgi:ribosomal protein L11 methyltransferase